MRNQGKPGIGTPAKLWSAWRAREDGRDDVADVEGRGIDTTDEAAIFRDFGLHRNTHNGMREPGGRMATPLDEMLVSLCRPERLLNLVRRFALFDAGAKKVARHPRFLAVKDLPRGVEARDVNPSCDVHVTAPAHADAAEIHERDRSLRSLYRLSDGVRGRGAAV